MTFEQAKEFLLVGLTARREDWIPGNRIQFKTGEYCQDEHPQAFGQLLLSDKVKPWQPYWRDFFADDWLVLGYSDPTIVRKLLSQAARKACAVGAK